MDYLILALATWRISSLITYEDGPFLVLERLRYRLGVRHNEYDRYATNELARGLLCLWCNSMWTGAAWALAYWAWRGAAWLALPFALSAAAVLVDETVNKRMEGSK